MKRSVEEIAAKRGLRMAQVATAWVLSKPEVTAPIVGSTKLANLQEVIGKYTLPCYGVAGLLIGCRCDWLLLLTSVSFQMRWT